MAVSAPVSFTDDRLQAGAYITDGVDLYEVTKIERASPYMAGYQVSVENCRSLKTLQFATDKIRSSFELVRAAPAAAVPDEVGQIEWEPPAGG